MAPDTLSTITACLVEEYNAFVVTVPSETLDGHYAHFCQRLAWPILNSQIPDSPRNRVYEESSWEEYLEINQAFADEVTARWQPGDCVWIHDYHLALVPDMVRRKLPDCLIGFFFHCSFPPSEIFRCLAARDTILEGVLGADLVGFQADEHRLHFVRACRRLLSVDVSARAVHFKGRAVETGTFPIGIDIPRLVSALGSPMTEEWVEKVRLENRDKHLIVGRDRLDSVTGIKQKLLAYEEFLNSYPEWVGKASRHRETVCPYR